MLAQFTRQNHIVGSLFKAISKCSSSMLGDKRFKPTNSFGASKCWMSNAVHPCLADQWRKLNSFPVHRPVKEKGNLKGFACSDDETKKEKKFIYLF